MNKRCFGYQRYQPSIACDLSGAIIQLQYQIVFERIGSYQFFIHAIKLNILMWSYIKAKLFTGIGTPSRPIPFSNLALADIRVFENRQLLSFAFDNIDEFRVSHAQAFSDLLHLVFRVDFYSQHFKTGGMV